jgi:LuxR family maltose regulon positive regulatory protein
LIAQSKPGEALSILARLLREAEHAMSVGRRLDILLVQALAFQAQGDLPKAAQTLSQALSLAERGGYIRAFVDKGPPMAGLLAAHLDQLPQNTTRKTYLESVLSAFGRSQVVQPQPVHEPLADPLSERELEILHLVAANLSNKEIAQTLYVSLNTVKTHIKRLYVKLDVHNRLAAINRATNLGLLDR